MFTYKRGGGVPWRHLNLDQGKAFVEYNCEPGCYQKSESSGWSSVLRFISYIYVYIKKIISYIAWNIVISNHFDVKIANAKFSFLRKGQRRRKFRKSRIETWHAEVASETSVISSLLFLFYQKLKWQHYTDFVCRKGYFGTLFWIQDSSQRI